MTPRRLEHPEAKPIIRLQIQTPIEHRPIRYYFSYHHRLVIEPTLAAVARKPGTAKPKSASASYNSIEIRFN